MKHLLPFLVLLLAGLVLTWVLASALQQAQAVLR
jgi:hypothetical protein